MFNQGRTKISLFHSGQNKSRLKRRFQSKILPVYIYPWHIPQNPQPTFSRVCRASLRFKLVVFLFYFWGPMYPPKKKISARYTRHVSKRNISKPSFWSSSNSMTKYLVPLGISFKLCSWDIYWGHAVQPRSTVGKSSINFDEGNPINLHELHCYSL